MSDGVASSSLLSSLISKCDNSVKCEFCQQRFENHTEFSVHQCGTTSLEFGHNGETGLKSETAVLVQFDKKPDKETTCRSQFSCNVCMKHFNQSNHLERHMVLHRALLVHKCDKCDKSFASEEFLRLHHKENHEKRVYSCSICSQDFETGETLIQHVKSHDECDDSLKLTCSVCELSLLGLKEFVKHIKTHLNGRGGSCVCEICGKTLKRLDNLKTHQKKHHEKIKKENNKLFLCVYCGKEFNSSSNMIVHVRRHTGENPYKCSQCDKGFPRSHDLKCHERVHSGEKPYLCTTCGKAFNKSNKLLRHTRVHTGERPYPCNLCNRAFTQSNDLKLHMRRHTGARPYQCGTCAARFIQSSLLKAHCRTHNHLQVNKIDLEDKENLNSPLHPEEVENNNNSNLLSPYINIPWHHFKNSEGLQAITKIRKSNVNKCHSVFCDKCA